MGFGGHVERADGASFAGGVELVEFYKGEGGVVGASADVESDLEGCEGYAAGEGAAECGEGGYAFDGAFGE